MTAASSSSFSPNSRDSSTRPAPRSKNKLEIMKPLLHLMLGTFLHIMSLVIVVPVITDVLLHALCPGEAECSQAIYLTGIQQVVTGVGTMFVTPILGELSDEYGRKPMLMIPLWAVILPMVILAYSRTKPFVYAYMAVGTVVRMFSEGGVVCLAFAYVGDCVEQRFRALAIGLLMGCISTGYFVGILLARILPEAQIFRVATAMVAFSAIYVQVFLQETNHEGEPLLPHITSQSPKRQLKRDKARSTPLLMRSTSSISETVALFKHNKLLTQVAIIVFFSNLGDAGVQSSLLYYLKATFGFAKDQFAELMLISSLSSVLSQFVVMPICVHFFGEKTVLCIGVFGAFLHASLYGWAWAPWVPYFCSSLSVFSVFVFPCIGSIVSKAAGPEDQGRLQGFVAGVKSSATILSPLVISPLTAWFLSESAPFKCPGFSLICAGVVMVLALVQAVLLEPIPPPVSVHKPSKYTEVLTDEVLQSQEALAEPLIHPGA